MEKFKKRHSRWYERLLFSTTMLSLLAFVVTILIPAKLFWDFDFHNKNQINSIVAATITLICITLSLKILMRFPGEKSSSFIISTVTSYYFITFSIIMFFRLDYSVLFLAINMSMVLLFCFTGYILSKKWLEPKIAFIELGRVRHMEKFNRVEWIELKEPVFPERRINAVVADLHSEELSAEWQTFLAKCALHNIPVYNVRQLEESLTGRVKIKHLYENDLGSLLPSPVYSLVKRIIDIGLILVTFPITLPIMVITAIAIRLESEGGAMFIQKRVGQGGKEFNIYKFRSMCKDSEKDGAAFAQAGDMRVTHIGKFIRKTRIDELPQFFNVLKGDMSLIGPRPEQKAFVDQFEKQIPFYSYRHIVKPGISGWAQVVQGYAADVDDTQVKIEHDFYYIKNFSLWLDVLIVFKTLKTMLTGFGAR